MPARTSATHPIQVDFIPKSVHGLDGQLGMTFAPGKKAPGLDGRWDRDLAVDLVRLRKDYATDVLISLIEDHELATLHIQELPIAAVATGIVLDRFAIPDGGVPADEARFAQLVEGTVAHVHAGKTVIIHCRGGLGRTGVLAASCLRALGVDANHAIEIVRAARAGAIENAAQEDFVRGVELIAHDRANIRGSVATRRSLEEILLHPLRIGSPPAWDDAPPEHQAALAAMDRLDDDALWKLAQDRRSEAEMVRYDELLAQRAAGALGDAGRSELEMLRSEADRFMLIKAHAAVLLRWRGHDIRGKR